MLKAFIKGDCHQPTAAYQAWLETLEHDVIEGEFGYERGEFTVYTTHWAALYEKGITPRRAWQHALDGFANKCCENEDAKTANYTRIVSEDQATIARQRANQSE